MTNIVTNYNIGDILEFKKVHPCGGTMWKVIRSGVDCKLECTTCKRIILIPRIEIAKKIKKIITKSEIPN